MHIYLYISRTLVAPQAARIEATVAQMHMDTYIYITR